VLFRSAGLGNLLGSTIVETMETRWLFLAAAGLAVGASGVAGVGIVVNRRTHPVPRHDGG
jgi:hypothetical protein